MKSVHKFKRVITSFAWMKITQLSQPGYLHLRKNSVIHEMQVVTVFVLLSLTTSALGCSCIPGQTEHDKYCRGDFGILVYVLDNGHVTGMDREYRIKLLHVYKLGGQDKKLLDQNRVFTKKDSSMCGTVLQKGKYYVLSGYYRRDGIMAFFGVGDCDYKKMFDKHPSKTYTPPTC